MQNINAVALTGNLTRDPELKSLPSGTSLCSMRVACNSRVKRNGDWTDKANYFDIVVFGNQAENCSKYLSKGRPIAVSGRLDWNEWTDKDGHKRQGVTIIADSVQFLGDGGQRDGTVASQSSSGDSAPPPVSTGDFAGSSDFGAGATADDDIPF